MDSSTTSKHTSRRHGQDRISQLPDPIIHHILRFLPIREAVQLGILAKRWMNLWASMQWFKIDVSDFYLLEGFDEKQFERFVDVVLIHRKPLNVDTFSLKLDCDLDNNHVNMWIVYAINHNARVLHLCIDTGDDLDLDLFPCLVTYHSLEELHVSLGFRQKISRRSITEFSRLKRLHFSGIVFIYNDLQKLIAGCPLIEDFRLECCDIMDDDSPRHCISSKTMRTLVIWNCEIQSMIRYLIPSLISLHYEDSNIARASFLNLSSLVHAFISDNGYNGSIQLGGVVDLIYGVSNAKILKLFGMRIEFIYDKDVPKLPIFLNLERLTIGSCCVGDNFEAVEHFLQLSPNLEYLSFKQMRGPESCSKVLQSAQSFSFDCPRLQIIKIRCFKTNERLLDFVKTLLANTKALHKIIIIPYSPSSPHYRLLLEMKDLAKSRARIGYS